MICPGMAAMEQAADHGNDTDHDGGVHAPCAFAAVFACGYVEHPSPVAVAIVISREDAPIPLAKILADGVTKKPFQSQAPPHYA
jgi:hypothetical protein